jgi:hypothetical protein
MFFRLLTTGLSSSLLAASAVAPPRVILLSDFRGLMRQKYIKTFGTSINFFIFKQIFSKFETRFRILYG